MQRLATWLAITALVAGCADATVNKQSVRATQTAPESTQVDVVRIPYDPSLFGMGKASNAYAASALGQANRAAMNDATTQIVQRLQRVR